jgi:hypothetical protein
LGYRNIPMNPGVNFPTNNWVRQQGLNPRL